MRKQISLILRSKLKDYLIVRTAQLCGIDHTGKNFVLKIIRNMKSGKKVYAADDLCSTPTYSGLLSDILIKLIEKDAEGIYHCAGAEFINRYDYVNKIADIFGLDNNLIQRVKLKDLKLKARRPKKGGLKIDKVIKEKIAELYDCEEGLDMLKKEMR
jgi:dTDP-4-dehydrorhamnose reductase